MMTIKQYRLERGMTQAELAAAMGVQQTNVSRWERGAIRPDVDTLRKLAGIFGCRMDDIAPTGRKLKAKDIFSPDAYEALTADERRRELKKEQACEYSGWRRYPTTMSKLMERIPPHWWETHTAEDIGEVMAMLKTAYDDGVSFGRRHPEA